MNKLICSVFIFLFFSLSINAQTWQWGRRGGGNNGINPENEKVIDMATDKNGNLYLLAQLGGGGDATLSTENGDSLLATRLYGGKDVALISYDCSGKLRWTKIFGCQYEDYAAGMSMDTLGHIYVAMNVNSIGGLYIDVDSFSSNINRKSIVLIQYDTAGDFKWLRQPNPDTTSALKNGSEYGVGRMVAMPNGDTYSFCLLGTGLISGSTNLVATTSGHYMIKYNVAGVPKELIKLDMKNSGSAWNYINFNVTASRKFLFTVIRSTQQTFDTLTVGGQQVKHPIFLCCFSQTGNVLWRIENTDTIGGGILGRPKIDETKGLIYVAGGITGGANGTVGDTIQNYIVKNSFSFSYPRGLPFIMVIDTAGVVQFGKNGSVYKYSSNLSDLSFRSDGRLFAIGEGATVLWDGFKFDNNKGIGFHIFMPSFDATTGTVLSMDSLLGSADATYAGVMTADNKNNIYVAGEMTYDVKVGSQTLVANGGVTDFFIAKYGTNNCSSIVPLKFLEFTTQWKQTNAVNESANILLTWSTANEINVSRFNVQSSINGIDWITVGTVMAKNKTTNTYTFIDANRLDKTLYYRIQSIDYDGQIQYSEHRKVDIPTQKNGIKIYPNPASEYINVYGNNIKEIQVIDYLGRVTIAHKVANTSSNTIPLTSLLNGIYFIKTINMDNSVVISKLVKE